MMKARPIALAAALLMSTAFAHEYDVGTLHVAHPHARPTVTGQPSGAAYLTIENKGKAGDRLLGASSPAAKSVEIHTMSMEGNLMKMREVNEIALKPGATVAMEPGGGYHLMLIGLRQPLKAGDKFPLTLTFEKAGKTEVSVSVENTNAKAAGAQHAH
jgi:periplasmic copper chaperone A